MNSKIGEGAHLYRRSGENDSGSLNSSQLAKMNRSVDSKVKLEP